MCYVCKQNNVRFLFRKCTWSDTIRLHQNIQMLLHPISMACAGLTQLHCRRRVCELKELLLFPSWGNLFEWHATPSPCCRCGFCASPFVSLNCCHCAKWGASAPFVGPTPGKQIATCLTVYVIRQARSRNSKTPDIKNDKTSNVILIKFMLFLYLKITRYFIYTLTSLLLDCTRKIIRYHYGPPTTYEIKVNW